MATQVRRVGTKLTIPRNTDLTAADVELDIGDYFGESQGTLRKQLVANELGWRRRLHHLGKAEAAIADTRQYMTDRKTAMNAAKKAAEDQYQAIYTKLIAAGYPESEAHARALKVASAVSEVEDLLVEEAYPTAVAAQIVGGQIAEKRIGYKKNLGLIP